MAIDKLGTNNDPDVKVQGSAVNIVPDTSRDEQIQAAAQVLVNDEQVLLDDEIQAPTQPQMSFDANLVNFIDLNTLEKISNDLLDAIDSDKQSRSEWEKNIYRWLEILRNEV
jgi:hypothetical protein